MKIMFKLVPAFLLVALAASPSVKAATKPVRVFVLAGQSNMEGHGIVAADPNRNGSKGSLEYLVKDASTAKRFAPLVDSAGHWRKRDDVWITYLDRKGPLTAGKKVPTGDQCWTLFLNTGNFKGPVAFFTPYFWSRPTVNEPGLAGMFLDARPSQPNRALQMETQYVPAVQSNDARGETYARIAKMFFPGSAGGDSVLVHKPSRMSVATTVAGPPK